MVHGFLLNNQLTDFSFRAKNKGHLIANRVEAGRRPRSSMSPTIVLKDQKPYLVIGSPGGSRIINYVANTLIAIIDWHMTLQESVNAPHLVNRFGIYELEQGTNAKRYQTGLEALGYTTQQRDLNSGYTASC